MPAILQNSKLLPIVSFCVLHCVIGCASIMVWYVTDVSNNDAFPCVQFLCCHIQDWCKFLPASVRLHIRCTFHSWLFAWNLVRKVCVKQYLHTTCVFSWYLKHREHYYYAIIVIHIELCVFNLFVTEYGIQNSRKGVSTLCLPYLLMGHSDISFFIRRKMMI
jgi:hypothetical protein